MTKLIQITDTHFAPIGQTTRGIDMAQRLRACLADIAQKHADATCLVVTGDLADAGDAQSYAHLRSVFAQFTLPPVRFLVGNTDDRAAFCAVFPDAPVDGDGFVQWRMPGEVCVIGLDSKAEGSAAGELCARRLDWLGRELAATADAPVVLFMHHHIKKLHLKRADEVPLAQPEALLAALAPHRARILLTVHGHTHTTISGSWHGYPFAISSGIPLPPVLEFDVERMAQQAADPLYAIIQIKEDGVAVFSKQVAVATGLQAAAN